MDADIEYIYDQLCKNLQTYDGLIYQPCIKFNEEWKIGIENKFKEICLNAKTEYNNQRNKILRNEKKCFIFGDTSAGKSSMINSILKQTDLPNRKGRTTNSFVEIRNSPNESTFIRINGEDLKIASLGEKINYTSEKKLKDGSKVEVFYNHQDCSFLKNGMVIVDTPGIDTDVNLDESIIKDCSDADLIILVVNATIAINNTMKRFIRQSSTTFSKLNFFLIYNHWDQMDDEDNIEDVKNQLLEDAEDLFRNSLKFLSNSSADRIFFLSAKERIEFNKNSNYVNKSKEKNYRNNDFDRFLDRLKKELSENSMKRRFNYIESLHRIQINIFHECEKMMDQIQLSIPKRSQDFLGKLKKRNNLEAQINSKIAEITKPIYNQIIRSSLREINSSNCDEITKHRRIVEVINAIFKDFIKEIKNDIIAIIKRNPDNDCLLIIEKMYFRQYLDPLLPNIDASVISDMNTAGNKRLGRTAGVAGAVAATGAVIVGAPVVAAAAVVGGIFGFIVMACGLGNPSENLYNTSVGRHITEYLWNDHERKIEGEWKKTEAIVCNSFSKFLTEINSKFPELFQNEKKRILLSSAKDKIISIQRDMDDFRSKYQQR